MGNDEIPINIFLDPSKAFDTLYHDFILSKLKLNGLEGVILALFKSYLKNRKQYFEYNDIISETLEITIRVPQGSILGPLLFIIYVKDFPQAGEHFQFIAYAFDTTLTSTLNYHDNSEAITHQELGRVYEWLKINKLSLNIKT